MGVGKLSKNGQKVYDEAIKGFKRGAYEMNSECETKAGDKDDWEMSDKFMKECDKCKKESEKYLKDSIAHYEKNHFLQFMIK